MHTIGEFARLGQVSTRALRYYDEIGLLNPAEVDPATGYRGYLASQLRRLNQILALRELGLSLQEIATLLEGIDDEDLRRMLVRRLSAARVELSAITVQTERLEARLRALEGEEPMIDDVIVKSLPATRLIVVGSAAPGMGPTNLLPVFRETFPRLRELRAAAQITTVGPGMAFYVRDSETREITAYASYPVSDEVVEIGEPAQVMVLPPVATAATIVREGNGRDVFPNAISDLYAWMEVHGYERVGLGRDIFRHTDPDRSKWVYEIQYPMHRPDEPIPDIVPKAVMTDARASV
jgi:DNA-binding transcriptional MerR regulator